MEFQKYILLSDFTTIKLGGFASLFLRITDTENLKEALNFANVNNLNSVIFSGGSNIIFPDNGYEGLVINIDIKGIRIFEDEKYYYAEVNAGENWNDFVLSIINAGYSGIECLSGIPGSVGATPVQNVGAYGQEVSETILSVTAIDRKSLKEVIFKNEECRFSYRSSRFKSEDRDKYVIVKVLFRFEKNKTPDIKYAELQKILEITGKYSSLTTVKDKLNCIRENVLTLRAGKSMVIDPEDVNSRSCGSFFTNPVLSEIEYEKIKDKFNKYNDVPVYRTVNGIKISAAWLVENAGFIKGFRKGGVGISSNHSLALININGTTDELLSLSSEIEKAVKEKFGIQLFKEPVVVSNI